jgi:L-iditol 2-dehydrogenase
MKALVKYAPGNGNLAVMDVPEPPCGPRQVKVEVAFCGVCGTDLHVMHDQYRNFPPVILGHELAGTVVETGSEVTEISVGKRVAVLGATSVVCGECAYCRSGYFIFCKVRRGMGHGVNGGFTQYVVCRPDQLYVVPDTVSFETAAVTEPFAAIVQAVSEVTPVAMGDLAVVSGPGPMGLLAVKLLVAEGIKTIVAGAPGDETRLEAARRFGAAEVVNVGERDLAEVVRAHSDGVGADVVFECAGHPSSVKACVEATRPQGRYTQVGICGREVPFPIDQVLLKQLTVQGSMTYTARTWSRVMRIYEQGRIHFDDLISVKLPVSEWQTAFDLCVNKAALKVLMYPEEHRQVASAAS